MAKKVKTKKVATKKAVSKKTTKTKAATKPRNRLTLQMQLVGFAPFIWRHLEISGDTTLRDLHHYTQACMDWTESHLYQFKERNAVFTDPRFEIDSPEDYMDVVDDKKVRLDQIFCEPGDELTYEYDFGDSWEVRLTLLTVTSGPTSSPAACIAGARSAPPDDCGGLPGFRELIESARDEKHERHHELIDWLEGKVFDLEDFDLAKINRILRAAPWKMYR